MTVLFPHDWNSSRHETGNRLCAKKSFNEFGTTFFKGDSNGSRVSFLMQTKSQLTIWISQIQFIFILLTLAGTCVLCTEKRRQQKHLPLEVVQWVTLLLAGLVITQRWMLMFLWKGFEYTQVHVLTLVNINLYERDTTNYHQSLPPCFTLTTASYPNIHSDFGGGRG